MLPTATKELAEPSIDSTCLARSRASSLSIAAALLCTPDLRASSIAGILFAQPVRAIPMTSRPVWAHDPRGEFPCRSAATSKRPTTERS